MIYGLQGLLLWFVSMPLQWIAFHENVDGCSCGLVLVAIGIFFEATADEQLRRFIANPHSRHHLERRTVALHPTPELLRRRARVEWLLRRGVLEWLGWLTILSPVVMIYLLTSLSVSQCWSESSPDRAGYDEYVATTSSVPPASPAKALTQFEKQPGGR